MARVCQVTGKGPMVGNNVSHANNKTPLQFARLPRMALMQFLLICARATHSDSALSLAPTSLR